MVKVKKVLSLILTSAIIFNLFMVTSAVTNAFDAEYSYIIASANLKIIHADTGEKDSLTATSSAVSDEESFKQVINSDGTISFLCKATNTYIALHDNGQRELVTRKNNNIGDWQKFTLEKQADGTVAIKSVKNKMYVTVDLKNDAVLAARSATVGINEKFTIVTPTIPVAPAEITVSSKTPNSISLSWTADTNIVSYNVYRSISSNGTYTKLNASPITSTSYTDIGLTANTTYYYEISAVNLLGESALSAEVSVTTPLDVPTGLTVSPYTANSVSLSWTALTDAASYNVYCSASSNGTYTKVNTSDVTSTSYTDTGLTDNTIYYYKVSAVNVNGESALSSYVSVTPFPSVLNDGSESITYDPIADPLTTEGGWFHNNLGKQKVNFCYNTDNHATNKEGATAKFTFEGTNLRIFVQGDPQGGLAEVSIDGGEPEIFDCYSSKILDYMLAYEKYGLSSGKHTVQIKVLNKSSQGEGKSNVVKLDFFDFADSPIFPRFLPGKDLSNKAGITPDYYSAAVNSRLAAIGPAGVSGVEECGFVTSTSSSPTINDLRTIVTLNPSDKTNQLAATITGLKQNTLYHVRPYVVVAGKVYYGEDSYFITKKLIELSNNIIGRIVGETATLSIKSLKNVSNVNWSIVSERRYNGEEADIIDIAVEPSNNVNITAKSEGQAIIRATSVDNPEIYSDCTVTVARAEKSLNFAQTPPMGWNSWNSFGRLVSKQDVINTIDTMSNPITADGKSLKDLGYQYVVIDGGWRQNWLESDGRIVPNDSFGGETGIKELADYAHSKGLKLGLHVVPGEADAAGQYIGAKGNEMLHLSEYKEWGIDFLKWDFCQTSDGKEDIYKKIKYFMDNSGRDILYSISAYQYQDWAPETGNMWRTGGDIKTIANTPGGAVWNRVNGKVVKLSVYDCASIANQSADAAGPGAWNDPDMMVVGDPGLNEVEWKSHFNLWSIMSSPLILGMNMASLHESPKVVSIITNEEMIAVNQDSLGKQGKKIIDNNGLEVWAKPLADGSMSVMLLNNIDTESKDITVNWSEVLYNDTYKLVSGAYKVRDLWENKNLGSFEDSFTAKSVPVHGSVVLKVSAPEVL